jgi:hypothetical protein
MRALWLALVAGCVATITDVQSPLGETIAKAMGVCADVDTSKSVATRSALGGYCCKYCDERKHVCCPSHDANTGEEVSSPSPSHPNHHHHKRQKCVLCLVPRSR